MNTLLGNIEDKHVIKHFDKMIGKIFKILHLKEEDCKTLDKYINSVCRKFIGVSTLYFNEDVLMVVSILKGIDVNNYDLLRSDVFEAIEIVESIKEKM